MIVRGCTCGGAVLLRANPYDDEAIAAAVRDHQATERHEVWRLRGGLGAGEIERLDAYETILDRKDLRK